MDTPSAVRVAAHYRSPGYRSPRQLSIELQRRITSQPMTVLDAARILGVDRRFAQAALDELVRIRFVVKRRRGYVRTPMTQL